MTRVRGRLFYFLFISMHIYFCSYEKKLHLGMVMSKLFENLYKTQQTPAPAPPKQSVNRGTENSVENPSHKILYWFRTVNLKGLVNYPRDIPLCNVYKDFIHLI